MLTYTQLAQQEPGMQSIVIALDYNLPLSGKQLKVETSPNVRLSDETDYVSKYLESNGVKHSRQEHGDTIVHWFEFGTLWSGNQFFLRLTGSVFSVSGQDVALDYILDSDDADTVQIGHKISLNGIESIAISELYPEPTYISPNGIFYDVGRLPPFNGTGPTESVPRIVLDGIDRSRSGNVQYSLIALGILAGILTSLMTNIMTNAISSLDNRD